MCVHSLCIDFKKQIALGMHVSEQGYTSYIAGSDTEELSMATTTGIE